MVGRVLFSSVSLSAPHSLPSLIPPAPGQPNSVLPLSPWHRELQVTTEPVNSLPAGAFFHYYYSGPCDWLKKSVFANGAALPAAERERERERVGFWVEQRFSAALAALLRMGLQPLRSGFGLLQQLCSASWSPVRRSRLPHRPRHPRGRLVYPPHRPHPGPHQRPLPSPPPPPPTRPLRRLPRNLARLAQPLINLFPC